MQKKKYKSTQTPPKFGVNSCVPKGGVLFYLDVYNMKLLRSIVDMLDIKLTLRS